MPIANTLQAELKRQVGRAIWGSRLKKTMLETAIASSIDEKLGLGPEAEIEAGGVRVVDVSESDLECTIQIKFYNRSTRYYKIKVSEIQ